MSPGLDAGVLQDLLHQLLHNLVRGLELHPADARLAVDAQAVLHLVVGQGKDRLILAGDSGAGEAHADAVHVVPGLAGHPVGLLQVQPRGGGGAGDLDDQHVAGDAPAVQVVLLGRGGHVVPHPHGLYRDIHIAQHLTCDVKVHVVAGIVAVDEEDTLAPVHGLGGLKDAAGVGGGEHAAGHGGVGQIFSHKIAEHGLMAAAAAHDHGGFVLEVADPDGGGTLHLYIVFVGGQEALHGLADAVLGQIHDFFRHIPHLTASVRIRP